MIVSKISRLVGTCCDDMHRPCTLADLLSRSSILQTSAVTHANVAGEWLLVIRPNGELSTSTYTFHPQFTAEVVLAVRGGGGGEGRAGDDGGTTNWNHFSIALGLLQASLGLDSSTTVTPLPYGSV